MKYPKISVITPSYNQGEFLEQTILSVLNQNYSNLEYIIIDGGSTDNSVKTIKKYQNRIAYWISEKDQGQSDAINKGLKLATGDIIGWINSDDLYADEDVFKRVVTVFHKFPSTDFIYSNCKIVDEFGNIKKLDKTCNFNKIILKYHYLIPQPTIFFRRKVIDKGFYIETSLHRCMDYDFFNRIYREFNFKYIDDYFAKFRHHKAQKSVYKKNEYTKKELKYYKEEMKQSFKNSYGYYSSVEFAIMKLIARCLKRTKIFFQL